MTRRWLAAVGLVAALLAGCSDEPDTPAWVEDDVTFVADGLTIHGTYRHRSGDDPGPAALLLQESGPTDRNGDNAIAGPVGNMRELAELLSDRGVASLRYDKVGTGKTGLGPYCDRRADVTSAVYGSGATAALKYLAAQSRTQADRISVYGLGEGATYALTLATAADVPKVHSLGLLQPLSGRYLDLITTKVRQNADADVSAERMTPAEAEKFVADWTGAVAEARTAGTVPKSLPQVLSAILNPGNVKAVVAADAIDPPALAADVAPGTPVLLTCSDSDSQAACASMKPLTDALARTALTFVELKGVSHVLKDDPTDSVANYAKTPDLAPQFVTALDGFAAR